MPWSSLAKKREYSRRYYRTHKEYFRQYGLKYREANKEYFQEYHQEYCRKYRETHKEQLRESKRKYWLSRPTGLREWQRRSRAEVAKSPSRRLSLVFSNSVRHSLAQGKGGAKTWEILGYNLDNLKTWLESLFSDGMTWGNYGKWHIDHIIPVSFFVFESADDVEFKMCWRLENLQPLWAADNYRKHDKMPDFSKM